MFKNTDPEEVVNSLLVAASVAPELMLLFSEGDDCSP